MDKYDIWDKYCDQHFRTVEGERGVRNLENLVSNLGYMHIEEFLADNPGAVEAIVEFVGDWVSRGMGNDWAEQLELALEECEDEV